MEEQMKQNAEKNEKKIDDAIKSMNETSAQINKNANDKMLEMSQMI